MRDKDGYVLLLMPDYPSCNIAGYVREHRFIMEKNIKRPLKETEVVHHINGIRDDNRLENLQLMSKEKHDVLTLASRPIPSNTSGFRGVSWNKEKRKWQSEFRLFHNRIFIGRFDDKQDARISYEFFRSMLLDNYLNQNE